MRPVRRLILLAFIWGWSFLFIKVAGEGLTPASVAFGRVALGALVLNIVLRQQGVGLPTDRTAWRHFTIAALVAAVVPFTLIAWGEQHITTALTAVLNASTPLFTAVLAALFLRERLGAVAVAGLVVGLAGVSVAAGLGASDLASSSLLGGAASVAAGLCYGIAFVYMRRYLTSYPPLVAATGQLTAGTVLLAPVALVTSLRQGVEMTPTRIVSIVLLGVFGTGLAYVLNYRIIGELGATRASVVTYVIPIVAVAVGIVVLDEHFAIRQLVGGLLIVIGITGVNMARWRSNARMSRVDAAAMAGRAAMVLVVVGLAAAMLSGCGGDSEAGSAGTGAKSCGPALREALDPNFLQHVLPNAPEPSYTSDPPTSGPHQPAPTVHGVLTAPLSKPRQIGVLETGAVLVQHRDATDADALAALASVDVVVAPNPTLRDRIVATAWTWKLRCDAVDADAIRAFARDHAGQAPGTTTTR
jgi:drug/metabolite transporter (DMT)-like permease